MIRFHSDYSGWMTKRKRVTPAVSTFTVIDCSSCLHSLACISDTTCELVTCRFPWLSRHTSRWQQRAEVASHMLYACTFWPANYLGQILRRRRTRIQPLVRDYKTCKSTAKRISSAMASGVANLLNKGAFTFDDLLQHGREGSLEKVKRYSNAKVRWAIISNSVY